MAMQRAVNSETGEVVFLVNNQWVPPAQVAVNEAGEKAYLVGNTWQTPTAPKVEEPKKDEKPSILAGTTLPPEQPVNPFNSPVGPEEMPTSLYTGDISKMPTAAETKAAQFGITPEMGAGEQALRTGKNLAYRASTGFEQIWLGGARLISDITGVGKEGVEGVSKQLSNETQAVQDTFKEHESLNLASNIGSSILQSVPAMVSGVSAGNMAAYATMYGQSFLQGYDEGRNKDLGVAAATTYGAINGVGEILGERLGFPKLTEAIKNIGKGVPAGKMASDVAQYLVKDLVGEELTSTIQFLNDAGFGITKYKSVDEALTAYLQTVVDTALVTMGQGAVLGGSGMVANSVLKKLRDAHSGGEKGYDLSAAEMVKNAGFNFNRPEQEQQGQIVPPPNTNQEQELATIAATLKDKYSLSDEKAMQQANEVMRQRNIVNQQQQQTAPPEQNQQAAPVPPTPLTTPPVISAEGTPIAPVPLDTAEKQVEAKASAPIGQTTPEQTTPEQTTPAAAATPAVQVEALAAKLMEEYGFSKEHALQVATEEIQHGTEQSNGVVPGTNQPSIPVPQNGLQPAGGNAALNVAGLANTVGATGVPGVRAEAVQTNEPSALTPAQVRSQANTAALDLYEVPKTQNPDGTFTYGTPAPAVQKQVDAYSMGAYDAAQGFDGSKYAEGFKGKAKTAYEAGFKSTQPTTETPEVTPTPVATKGKRGGGRKPTIKTPELIAQAQLASKQNQKTNKDAIRDANAAAAVLEQPAPEQGNFASQAAYLDASMQYRARRNQALDALHEISKGSQRDNAGGKKAKEALAHPSISTQEQNALQQRIELRRKQGQAQVSKAKQTTTISENNPKYEGFKTTQQAIKHILENGTAFEKFLVRRLQPFLKGVNLVIVRSADDIPNKKIAGEEDKTLKNEFNGANGMYATYKENGQKVRTIFLRSAQFGNMNYQGTNNTVFLHEALHAAINARINEYISMEGKNVPAKLQAAMDALHKTMNNARNEYADRLFLRLPISREVQEIFDITDGFEDLKEFVTYGITTDAMQQFLLESKGEIIAGQPGAFRSLFRGFVNAVRDLFNMDKNHTSALQDLLLVSESLMKYELQGPIKEEASLAKKTTAPKPKLTETERKLLASPENLAKGSQTIIDNSLSNPQKANILVQLMRKSGEAKTKAILASLSTNVVLYLSNRLNGPIHAIGDIDTYLTEMRGMQNRLKRAAMAKLEPLARFASKDPVQAQLLADTMHRATLNKFDPARHASLADALRDDVFIVEAKKKIGDLNFDQSRAQGTVTARENKIKKGYEEWNKLNKEAKEHYVMVRDYYRQMFNLYRSLLDKKVEALQLSGKDTSNLMASIRQIYEDAQKSGVYFPLMRYGKHWIKVQDGTLKGTYMFENISAMEDFKNNYFPNWDDLSQRDKVSSGNDITTLRKSSMSTETAMLKNVFSKLEGKESLDIEALKDDVYQLYLMSSSEQSLKNRFIHRKGTAGFSSDIVRNFATSNNQYANQLSKLEYGEKLQNAMSAASKAVESTARGSKAGYYVAEINKRVKEELSPDLNDDAFSQAVKFANNAAFVWMLTGYKQIANQMISLGTYGTSVLAANKNYSFKEVGEMMLKYSNLYKSVGVKRTDIEGNKRWASPSLLHSTYVRENPILTKAAEKMKEIGIADDTFVNSLTEIAKKPPINDMDSYSTKVKKVAHAMTIGGAAIATGERLSREMMFMSSFELAYNHSKDFDSAFKQAIKDTHEALFSYESFNKSRLSKHPVGKFVFQFQHYKLQATFFMFRNMAELAKPTDGHTRQEALIKLMGSTLGTAAFAGVDIMGYSVMCAFIDLIAPLFHLAGDPEDEDWVKFRVMGADAWFRLHYLPKVFGEWSAYIEKGPISAATGIDFSASVGTDNMWFKDLPHKRSFIDSLNAFIVSLAGAPVSAAANLITGVHDLFTESNKLRALEKASPAFAKGIVGAIRQGTQGEKTKEGAMIKEAEKFGAFKAVTKTLGFQDTEVAQVLEYNYTLKGLQEAGNQARDAAYKKMGNALDDDNIDAFDAAWEKYQESVYGQIAPMTAESIQSFAKNHVKNQAITEQGLRLSKPYKSFFEEEVTNTRSKEYK
jgi:hypothetical protein